MRGWQASTAAEASLASKGSDVRRVLRVLASEFPNSGAMEVGDPYRTLVAVILSARTRDEQVLKLLPKFFKRFPNVKSLACATPTDISPFVNSIGMYRQKARNIQAMAKVVMERFGGRIPDTMDDLVTLKGVGRKTASVALVACFDRPAIAVDTHVHRVTHRLGWVKTKTPQKTEEALLALVPKNLHRMVNRVFVKFGRYVCIPGRPRCWMCPVRDHCVYSKKNLTAPRDADQVRDDLNRREIELERLRRAV
jgi:endonuclease-3